MVTPGRENTSKRKPLACKMFVGDSYRCFGIDKAAEYLADSSVVCTGFFSNHSGVSIHHIYTIPRDPHNERSSERIETLRKTLLEEFPLLFK